MDFSEFKNNYKKLKNGKDYKFDYSLIKSIYEENLEYKEDDYLYKNKSKVGER